MSEVNPFAQLWADITAEAEKVKTELVALGKELATEAVADIEAVFKAGAPLVLPAILAEAPKLISGEEKFGNAVTNVAQQLQVQLGPVLIQDVQALVQTGFRSAQKIATGG